MSMLGEKDKVILPLADFSAKRYTESNNLKISYVPTDEMEDIAMISESAAKKLCDVVEGDKISVKPNDIPLNDSNATYYGSDIITGFGSETGKDDRVDLIKALHEAGKVTIERIEKGETTKEDNDMIDFLHDLFNV